MRALPLQTGLTIATLGIAWSAARLVSPAMHGPDTALFGAIVDFRPGRTPVSPLIRRAAPEPARLPAPSSIRMPESPGTLPRPTVLLDDRNGALDHFYAALARTEKKEPDAVTRIIHYGDSPTTADLITGDARAMLQQRYGDAGHGFVLVAKPWAWYQHDGVQVSGSGWKIVPASHFETHDGLFGLGGVSFTGGAAARSRIVFERGGQSRFEVWFLRQPDGGSFTVSADGRLLGRVDTAAPVKTPGFASFAAGEPARVLELQGEGANIRVFGVAAEKEGPGVVYDSLGLNGASITVLSRMFNEDHWAAELAQRHPDLAIVNYGTNEADFAAFVDRQYEKELREAIRRLRAALPEASILIMSPMDRGSRNSEGEIETMDTIPRIVETQRRVAAETGCGFFDTFAAMGGAGTMARWYDARPRLVSADFIHPYPAGGKIIASTFTGEITAGLDGFKLRQWKAAAPGSSKAK